LEVVPVPEINKKPIILWQLIGFFVLVGVGSLLHFTYAWSGYSPIVGMMSSVNESVWEHLKLGFWSMVLFSLVEYWFVRKQVKQYFLAKALGLLTLQFFIITFFYIYTIFTGEEVLIIDIISYVLGAALCQAVSYRLMTDREAPSWGERLGIWVLAAHLAMLVVFTFWTPRHGMFADPHSGTYGTTWHVDADHLDDHEH
jgi:hypothetical protein